MDSTKLLQNFERLLNRFTNEELAATLSAYESNPSYGGPSIEELELWISGSKIFKYKLDNRAWFEITSSYYTKKHNEIGLVFADSNLCSYNKGTPIEVKDTNHENPQNEFAGFFLPSHHETSCR